MKIPFFFFFLSNPFYIKNKKLEEFFSFMSLKWFQQMFHVSSCKRYLKDTCGVVKAEDRDRKLKPSF